MASLDIGIDLGTSNIIASDSRRGIIVKEPTIVAYHWRQGRIIAMGTEVTQMVGRTPDYIEIIRPLSDGIISNYKMTGVLIRFLLEKICPNLLIKPRVTICVPSGITGVGSQAVINAALSAGARKVYLIEEPVAAAIGAGIELSRPNGNMVMDIGGGTADIAVLSLNGIVCKTSLKVAGQKFDEAIIKYMRSRYNILMGERSAEQIKMQIGSVFDDHSEDLAAEAKGRDLLLGLPRKILIRRSELRVPLLEQAALLVRAAQGVLEKTPPELVGDIKDNGIFLTGGGALLHGMDRLLEKETKVPVQVAENAQECVAIGTAKSFSYLDILLDGFVNAESHSR